MIRIKRTQPPPTSLAHQKTLKSGKYNCDDVKNQLHHDFHGKCYICESLLLDREVEHLLPHHDAKFPERENFADEEEYNIAVIYWNRKFEWRNLFPACRHCNGLKGKQERNIIDCCKSNPERVIRQKMNAARVFVTPNNPDDPYENETAALIQDCFMTTGSQHLDADARKRRLKIAISVINRELEKYQDMKANGDDVAIQLEFLRQLVQADQEYAGFVRTEVRDCLDACPELSPLVAFDSEKAEIEKENHIRTEVSV